MFLSQQVNQVFSAAPAIDQLLRGYAAGAVAWFEAKIRGRDWAGNMGVIRGLT